MAWAEHLSSINGRVQLNNGTSQTGNVLTKNISVGTLNPSSWDIDKFGAIVQAMEGIFANSVYNVQDIKTYDVTFS